MNGDPAIRWRALDELTDATPQAVAAARSCVATEGWGKALLDRQLPNGAWAEPDDGWMISMDALTLLREMGLDPKSPQAHGAIARVRHNLHWEALGSRPYFEGETEACINGAILAFGSYFGERCDTIVDRLLSEQLADGGWNCESPPSVRSSFNSTIRVLEGLNEYERRWGHDETVAAARLRGQEYLLERRMFRRLSDGAVVDRRWMRFAYPTLWHYDILRGLDYLRSANAEPDVRASEAIEIVQARRHQNSRWPMNRVHAGRLAFPIEPETSRASRWNTLRAMRVVDWYFGRPKRNATSSAR
jgi:hypothetical protein